MAEIIYTYHNQVYANITNKCDCRCRFCIRNTEDAVGEADTLWHEKEPTVEEIKKAMDDFDFTGYKELVYCGYGEPTCELGKLLETAKYAKEKYGVSIRINTNGLANLYHKKDIIPQLEGIIDCLSISLNAPDKETYMDVTRPAFEDAFEGLQDFIRESQKYVPNVKVTVVDVLSEEDIEKSRLLAEKLGAQFRVRKYAP